MTPATSREERAAGGVVFRRSDDGIEIVLVVRPAERLWALPKGKPNPGESVEETALREVREETGLDTRIVEPLGDVTYWYTDPHGVRTHKVVDYFLMEAVGGDLADHDAEFDEVGWFHLAEAQRRLTHRNQLHILHRVAERTAVDA